MEKVDKLVLRVKEGDSDAYSELLKIFKNMIYKISYSMRLERGDFKIQIEDLFQEGCVALHEAAIDYDDTKGAKFSSFAYLVIKRRIIRKTKEFLNGKLETYSLDAFESPDYLDEYQALRVAQNPVDYHHSMSTIDEVYQFINKLTKRDKEIIYLMLDNHSYQQIASELNITEKMVDNRLYRLRKELRKYMFKNETNQ